MKLLLEGGGVFYPQTPTALVVPEIVEYLPGAMEQPRMVERITEVLKKESMRNVDVFQAIGTKDWSAGDEAIWDLVDQKKVLLMPDSKLKWIGK